MNRAKEVTYYNDRYKGSLSEDVCDAVEQLLELDSENGEVTDLKHYIYNMSDSDVTDYIETMDAFGSCFKEYNKPFGTLRDEQTVGIALMYYVGNCILGDSVGMGKTVEVAGLCNLLKNEYKQRGKSFRYLLLTEKNLADQVRSEMVKFTADYTTLIPSGEKDVIDYFTRNNPFDEELKYSVVGTHALFTTSGFLAWLEQARTYGKVFPFDMLIVDESSPLGGKTTNNIVQGFKNIKKYFKRIVFLNATPFESKLEIFFNQLNLLDDKYLPTKTNFQKQYVVMDYRGMYPKPTGRYKNQAEFKRLIGYRYFARTRRDKGAVMEDCKGGIVYSPLSKIQKEWLEKTQLNRMVYDCPTYFDDTIDFCIENVPKLGSLNNLLLNDCADADSILIFSHFKETQAHLSRWLSNKGYSNRVLNGETKDTDRANIIKGFKNKEYKILITNVQKGLNFGDCNYCIFFSFDPNPSKMIQFEGRTTRSFDIIGKNVYILCSLGKEKRQLLDVVRQRAKATSDMTNTDLSVVMSILLGDDYNENNKEE